jgi:SAM-dependent methyltransferase
MTATDRGEQSAVFSSCRACGGALTTTMADLGMQPPSNAYVSSRADFAMERFYPLRAKVCSECRLVQVDFDVPPRELFSDYAYFSSYSETWMEHARQYCEMVRRRFGLGLQSLVVELASNDGYLLKNFVSAGVPVLGIDPSDTVAAAAEKQGVPTLVEYFGTALAKRLVGEGRKADLIVGNNVLAHVPDVNDFVGGIATLLKSEGTVTIEFPHLLTLIEHVEFDTIYHEHYSYLSLLAVERVFARHGLKLFDVQELPTHGGSLRIFGTHAARMDVHEGVGLLKVREDERQAQLDELSTYVSFHRQVEACRDAFLSFLTRAKASGKTVAGYGAAAKGNTLLNFCGVTTADIPLVADRNPHKQKKLLPGTHIPIVSPEELMAAKPDYVLILPWNLREEVMKQLAEVRNWDGRFVTAVPLVHVHD